MRTGCIEPIYRNGYIADLRSHKSFTCHVCRGIIEAKTKYYSIVIGGGGLRSLKFPDRVHEVCLASYFGGGSK